MESDADSISSYSNAPTNCIDDEMTTKDKSPKAGLAYSSNENDLIWQAYNSEDAPEGRNKALRRIAKQLGRTYNGVRKHIQHLQRKCAPRLKCLKSSESVDSNSGTSDSTSSCFGSRKRSTNLLVATSSSQSAQFTKRIQRGTGYQYTEEEDKAIWTAYLSSTNKRKQDEALRAVALKYGRTFGAVRLHLSIMRDAQYTGIAAAGATSTSHMSSDSEESGSDAGNEVHQVHQVSDLSDSGSEYHSPSAHASQDAQNVPTPTVTAQCGNHYYPPSDSLVKPFTEQPVTSSASVSAWLTSNSREDWQSDRLPVHVPSHTTAVQSPFTPPSANKYGHSEMSLSYYRNTVRPEVYAPETVNATLGGFIKTLRAENMDLIFPPEAHDQVRTYHFMIFNCKSIGIHYKFLHTGVVYHTSMFSLSAAPCAINLTSSYLRCHCTCPHTTPGYILSSMWCLECKASPGATVTPRCALHQGQRRSLGRAKNPFGPRNAIHGCPASPSRPLSSPSHAFGTPCLPGEPTVVAAGGRVGASQD